MWFGLAQVETAAKPGQAAQGWALVHAVQRARRVDLDVEITRSRARAARLAQLKPTLNRLKQRAAEVFVHAV